MTESSFLRVKNWAKLYENNRTRDMKHMAWVPVPNKLDSEGYTELVSHPNGAAHFGAWVIILEIASRCDERGTLLRGNGKPHSAHSLSTISRIPVEIFDDAIPRLLEIGWLELSTPNKGTCTLPQEPAVIPHLPAVIPHPTDEERKERKERNGTEETALPCGDILTDESPVQHTGSDTEAEPEAEDETRTPVEIWFLEEFWSSYPLHKAKAAALKAAKAKVKTKELREAAMVGLKRQLPDMLANPGFVPHASTWLNGTRWEDEPQLSLVAAGRPVDRFDRHGQQVDQAFESMMSKRMNRD